MSSQEAPSEHEAMQMKVMGILQGAVTSNIIYFADKHGIYQALDQAGHCSPATLSNNTGFHERFITEFLRQHAAIGLISCNDDLSEFWLTPAQADVLAHEDGSNASPWFSLGGFRGVPDFASMFQSKMYNVWKTGMGLDYDAIGEEAACATCRFLSVWQKHFLVEKLGSIPGLKEKLDDGIMVADVGCGWGVALFECASAWPNSTFHGYDISNKALSRAKESWKNKHSDLVNIDLINPGLDDGAMPAETYDLAVTHDAVHDAAYPFKMIKSVYNSLKSDGMWILGDMNALSSHADNVHNHPMAPLMYAISVNICLPSAMSAEGAAGLGTMGLTEDVLREMAIEAGFKSCEVVDTMAHPLNRYYCLKK